MVWRGANLVQVRRGRGQARAVALNTGGGLREVFRGRSSSTCLIGIWRWRGQNGGGGDVAPAHPLSIDQPTSSHQAVCQALIQNKMDFVIAANLRSRTRERRVNKDICSKAMTAMHFHKVLPPEAGWESFRRRPWGGTARAEGEGWRRGEHSRQGERCLGPAPGTGNAGRVEERERAWRGDASQGVMDTSTGCGIGSGAGRRGASG